MGIRSTSASRYQRRRRQASDTQRSCREIDGEARCSQSYLEGYYGRISKCGPIANNIILGTESNCRRNENGLFCREVLNSEFISGNCSSNCTSECRSILMQAGCCLNHTTGVNQDFLANCGIPVPLDCPSITSAEIPDILTNGSCDGVLEEIVLETQCDLVVMDGLLVTPLKENGNCLDVVEDYFDYCSSRSEQYCLVEFNRTTITQLLEKAENECTMAMLSNCSSRCRSSLEEMNSTFGCCTHAVNSTRSGHESPSALRYDLWMACDVTIPTRCEGNSTAVPAKNNSTPSTAIPTQSIGTTSTPVPIQSTGTPSTPVPIQSTGTPSTPVPIQSTGTTPSTPVPIQSTGTPSTPVPIQSTGTPSTPVPIQSTGTPSTPVPI